MNTHRGWVAAAVAVMMGVCVPAQAQSVEEAVQVRQLDMMLMVTSLRCRFGQDDFRGEYDAFRVRHLPSLRDSALLVTADYARRMGQRGATDAFDRISVAMANRYGAGHPTMDCAQLKQAVGALTAVDGVAGLVAAANTMLEPDVAADVVLAQR